MPLIRPTDARTETSDGPLGPSAARLLSDAGGLTQFGAFVEVLPPGSTSSHPHWHAQEDEMIFLLTGTLTLIEGASRIDMHPGDAACFIVGTPVGHCLRNGSSADASYLVIGTRSGNDVVTFPATGATVTIRDGIKTYRDADGRVTKTAPYHGA